MPNIEATKFGRGSGSVTTGGGAEIITFPRGVKIVSVAVKATAAATMNVRYTFDGEAGTVLWSEWDHGSSDDSRVWDAVFDGGFHQIEISGDGDYSYSWD
jgi:hypothetical protein